MSNFGNANSPVSSPPLRTWDFMETAFVGLIAYGIYTLAAMMVLQATHEGANAASDIRIQTYGVVYIVASPLSITALWIATRMIGRDFTEYLALNWPSSREFRRALGITAMLLLAECLALFLVGGKDISPNPYLSPRPAAEFLIFLIGVCIAGPIMEEFVVRGFVFRGWSQSFLGPVGAIVVTSILWASMHTQYDWFQRFWIFVTGLALGHFRWRSNSTWLTVMVHSAINMFAACVTSP